MKKLIFILITLALFACQKPLKVEPAEDSGSDVVENIEINGTYSMVAEPYTFVFSNGNLSYYSRTGIFHAYYKTAGDKIYIQSTDKLGVIESLLMPGDKFTCYYDGTHLTIFNQSKSFSLTKI